MKRICERSVSNRDNDTEKEVKFTNNKFLRASPSRLQEKVTRVAKERANESKKRWAVKKHSEILEKKGIELGVEHQDLLFPKNLKELGNKFFDKEQVSKDDLSRYLWEESCTHAHTTKQSGRQSVSTCMVLFYYLFCQYFTKKNYSAVIPQFT